MESALTHACQLKVHDFEGPFDLLFHLIEKNKVNLWDIPVAAITDQYMEYLFAMQEMDLEVASEFLILASQLLHIKSRMLLPKPKEEKADDTDPRQELVERLLAYRRFRDFAEQLRERESLWSSVWYKLPEIIPMEPEVIREDMDPAALAGSWKTVLERMDKRRNNPAPRMAAILQQEKVSLRSKVREVIRNLLERSVMKFSELFSFKDRSKLEIVTGFLAVLELNKLKRVSVEQDSNFGEIVIRRKEGVEEPLPMSFGGSEPDDEPEDLHGN